MYMPTVGQTYNLGGRVRLWCFRCFRHDIISPEARNRYWNKDLRTWHPLCRECRRSDQTLALPASAKPFEIMTGAAALVVERYFHGMRKKGRR